jgi:hypothetical protein
MLSYVPLVEGRLLMVALLDVLVDACYSRSLSSGVVEMCASAAPTFRQQALYGVVCQFSDRSLLRGDKMILPTPDQTAALWMMQTWGQKYCYVQDIFPSDSPTDRAHRSNCRLLIKRNYLRPEVDDGLKPFRRSWDMTIRYHLIPSSLYLPYQPGSIVTSPYRSEALNTAHIG